MTIRPILQCKSDIPDDRVEDEHDIVQFGGRAAALALGDILKGLGYSVDEPIDCGEAGWEFNFDQKPHRFRCRVSLFEEDGLYSSLGGPKRLFGGYKPEFVDMLSRFNDALAADGRFHDIRWDTHDKFTLGSPGGEPRPVDP